VFRAKAVVCKAQKVEFGQAAAAAAVATSLIAGVSGRKLQAIVRWFPAMCTCSCIDRSARRCTPMDAECIYYNGKQKHAFGARPQLLLLDPGLTILHLLSSCCS
jgi:hypothetical protein